MRKTNWEDRYTNRQPPPATPKAAPKRMKRNTAKRAKADRAKQPARRAFVTEAEVCMVCRQRPGQDAHEIASGNARERCLDQFDLIIVCCRECHDRIQGIKPAIQIAIRAAWWIDAVAAQYCELKGYAPTHVTRNDVLGALEYAPELR